MPRSVGRWKGPVPERTNKQFEVQGSPEHEAHKAKKRAYYHKNKGEYQEVARKNVAARRLRNQKWMVEYLKDKECSCGVNDPRILTFNHLEPGDKYANIADLVSRGYKISHLVEEVKKCEVVCHNCHMLITLEALGGSYHDKLKSEQ